MEGPFTVAAILSLATVRAIRNKSRAMVINLMDYTIPETILLHTIFPHAQSVTARVRRHVLGRPEDVEQAWVIKESYTTNFNIVAVAVCIPRGLSIAMTYVVRLRFSIGSHRCTNCHHRFVAALRGADTLDRRRVFHCELDCRAALRVLCLHGASTARRFAQLRRGQKVADHRADSACPLTTVSRAQTSRTPRSSGQEYAITTKTALAGRRFGRACHANARAAHATHSFFLLGASPSSSSSAAQLVTGFAVGRRRHLLRPSLHQCIGRNARSPREPRTFARVHGLHVHRSGELRHAESA
jgi:hypothetical protein